MDLEQEDFTVSQFKEFKDEGDHIDFVIPSEFNLVAEKTILLTKLKKNDKYPWQKKKKKKIFKLWSACKFLEFLLIRHLVEFLPPMGE